MKRIKKKFFRGRSKSRPTKAKEDQEQAVPKKTERKGMWEHKSQIKKSPALKKCGEPKGRSRPKQTKEKVKKGG